MSRKQDTLSYSPNFISEQSRERRQPGRGSTGRGSSYQKNNVALSPFGAEAGLSVKQAVHSRHFRERIKLTKGMVGAVAGSGGRRATGLEG